MEEKLKQLDTELNTLFEMGRYMPVCHTGTSLFLNFIPALTNTYYNRFRVFWDVATFSKIRAFWDIESRCSRPTFQRCVLPPSSGPR
jgi:hypothetical protein